MDSLARIERDMRAANDRIVADAIERGAKLYRPEITLNVAGFGDLLDMPRRARIRALEIISRNMCRMCERDCRHYSWPKHIAVRQALAGERLLLAQEEAS